MKNIPLVLCFSMNLVIDFLKKICLLIIDRFCIFSPFSASSYNYEIRYEYFYVVIQPRKLLPQNTYSRDGFIREGGC